MIDLHAHPLPGVDDGPATREDALALVRAAAAAGTRILCATPHIELRLRVDPLSVGPATRALQDELEAEGIAVALVAGGEVAAARAVDLSDEELRAVALGDGPWVLLECPLHPHELAFEPAVDALHARGHEVLLAHPERSPLFLREPARLEALVARGALCSITAGALAGQFGAPARELGLTLLADGLAHNVASDAHDARRRPPDLTVGLRAAEDDMPGAGALDDWLCRAVPEAILAGAELPPRPEVPALRRASRWRWPWTPARRRR